MNRKGLRALVVAVPLAGLFLVWRVGQRARDEADVYESSLRFILDWSGGYAGSKVFVSLNEHDPPSAFLKRFNDLTSVILPASTYATKSGPNTALPPTFAFKDIQWADQDKASVVVRSAGSRMTCVVQRHDGRWKLAQPITISHSPL